MIVLTAGDDRFREMILASQRQTEACGYKFEVFDLGGLGFGRNYTFDLSACGFYEVKASADADAPRRGKSNGLRNWIASVFRRNKQLRPKKEPLMPSQERFAKEGCYLELEAGRFSRALHKPWLIEQCLRNANDFILYLDGDAMLLGRVDQMLIGGYDIGLVLRPNGDVTWSPHTSGQINAGVVVCAPTQGARDFVEMWKRQTVAAKNDQVALNELLGLGNDGWRVADPRPSRKRRPKHVFDSAGLPRMLDVQGVRIKLFEYTYNCYTSPLPNDAKIVHFKGDENKRRFDEFQFLCGKLGYEAA